MVWHTSSTQNNNLRSYNNIVSNISHLITEVSTYEPSSNDSRIDSFFKSDLGDEQDKSVINKLQLNVSA